MVAALSRSTSLNNKYPGLLFFACALLYTLILQPGQMSIDSQQIYAEALTHQYSDHHPPMMALLWHHLNNIHPGPLLMFLINMMMLWGCVYLLYFKIFAKSPFRSYLLALPFLPWVMIYAGFLWKDLIFTFGYAALSLWLAEKQTKQEQMNVTETFIFYMGLVYFTSVKYQAQFIAPFILFWYCHIQLSWITNRLFNLMAKFGLTLLAGYLLAYLISFSNHFIVTQHGNGSSHAWQYVKIYDLAGMSHFSGDMLVPKTLQKNSKVTLEKISTKYQLAWEPLIAESDSPLRRTQNDKERTELLATWQSAVLSHPIAYLQHRTYIWVRGLLLGSPIKSFIIENYHDNSVVMATLFPLATIFAYIFILPMQLFMTGYSILHRKNPYAFCCFFLNLMGLTLLLVLFVKSLAAVPRYIYFTTVFFWLSLPFFIQLKIESSLKHSNLPND